MANNNHERVKNFKAFMDCMHAIASSADLIGIDNLSEDNPAIIDLKDFIQNNFTMETFQEFLLYAGPLALAWAIEERNLNFLEILLEMAGIKGAVEHRVLNIVEKNKLNKNSDIYKRLAKQFPDELGEQPGLEDTHNP